MNDVLAAPPTTTELSVEFCEESLTVQPGMTLTFGRKADVVVDESNRYLHRVVGEFRFHGGRWWVLNRGAHTPLLLHSVVTGSILHLGPGAEVGLSPGRFEVRFTAGPGNYQLDGVAPGEPLPARHGSTIPADDDETAEWGVVDLNREQKMLLLALSEPMLREPGQPTIVLPSNRQAAHRLGWTITKFNRKLDHVCAKFARAGVTGIHGGPGIVATDRRTKLVAHCLEHGILVDADLAELAR